MLAGTWVWPETAGEPPAGSTTVVNSGSAGSTPVSTGPATGAVSVRTSGASWALAGVGPVSEGAASPNRTAPITARSATLPKTHDSDLGVSTFILQFLKD